MKMNCLIVLLAVMVVSGKEGSDGNDNKIIGGKKADIGEFPYIVSIQVPSQHSCGGCLLYSNVVLTACHCLVKTDERYGRLKTKDPSEFSVVAGVVNLAKRDFSSFRRLEVNQVKEHPKCEKPATGWNWDFGMIQLKGSFPKIPGKLGTVAMPPFPERPNIMEKLSDLGVHCVAAGWGLIGEYEKSATLELFKVDLHLLPIKTCESTMNKYAESVGSSLRFKPKAQVCTLGDNGKDACRGDSGGPLLCDTAPYRNGTRGKELELVATVSWGIGCGRKSVPGGWARLDAAYGWIIRTAEEMKISAPSAGNSSIPSRHSSLGQVLKKTALLNLLLIAIINAYL